MTSAAAFDVDAPTANGDVSLDGPLYVDRSSPQVLADEIRDGNVRDAVGIGRFFARPSTASSEGGEDDVDGGGTMATVSGAGGEALAEELRRRLVGERKVLDRLYRADVY